jgi:hypothetical protein
MGIGGKKVLEKASRMGIRGRQVFVEISSPWVFWVDRR